MWRKCGSLASRRRCREHLYDENRFSDWFANVEFV